MDFLLTRAHYWRNLNEHFSNLFQVVGAFVVVVLLSSLTVYLLFILKIYHNFIFIINRHDVFVFHIEGVFGFCSNITQHIHKHSRIKVLFPVQR